MKKRVAVIMFHYLKQFSLLLILFSLCTGNSYAQKETYIWYFGYQAGIDFNSGAPLGITTGVLSTNEGCASICDKNGNLLFYSDGSTAWNRNHEPMPNGSGLAEIWYDHPGTWSSAQAALIVPLPGSGGVYYLFTIEQAEVGHPDFMYSVVDMSLQGGLGDIILRDTLMGAAEKNTAIQHQNGNDAWIICNSDSRFYAFLLSASGVSNVPVISNTGPVTSSRGYMKASPNGKKILVASENKFILYDFDNSTGLLSNAKVVDKDMRYAYSAEFSPDNTKCYLNARYPATVVQYDLEALDIEASVVKVAESEFEYGAFQLGPDQRIYIASDNNPFLDVIENPNAKGVMCNYHKNEVDLQYRLSALGLPNHYNAFLKPSFTWKYSCSWNPVIFSVTEKTNALNVFWDFGDSESGALNSSTSLNPSHIFSSIGNFKVTLITNYSNYTDTVVKNISFSPEDTLCGIDVFIPSAFSPNGDAFNNVLFVRSNMVKIMDFKIFDRWGEMVFTTNDVSLGWDGTYKGKECNTGIYVYYFKANLKNGKELFLKGNINLLR